MHTTSHAMPSELAEIIETHRQIFGGFTMMADEAPKDPEQEPADSSQKEDEGFKSAESKARGLEDLHSTRQENQQLKEQLGKLAPLERLVEALAPEQAADPMKAVEDRLQAAEQRATQAEHRALVAEVTAGLSPDDVEVVSKISDPVVMAEVAKRLRDASADQPGIARRTPKPDMSVGSGGDAKSTSVDSGRDLYRSKHSK